MSGQKTKAELVVELNRYLLVEVHWERMLEEDLLKLCEAFERLRRDVEGVFGFLDEVLDQAPLTLVEDSKKEWKRYTT